MPTKIYWIHHFNNGARIGIMPRPRGGDWLEDEIAYLKRQQVTLLVCLLETEEVQELQLHNEEAECVKKGISFIHFPIKDRNIPTNPNSFIKQLLQKTKNEEVIVIHCRMGIGRASIIAACLLFQNGQTTDEILKNISAIRGIQVPDTEEQAN